MSQRGINIDPFIPKSLGTKEILFENVPVIGTVEFFDGVLLVIPSVLMLTLSDAILPGSYSSVFGLVVFLAFGSLLVVKPSYMSLYSWLQLKWDFRNREKNLTKKMSNSEGKPFESYSAVPDNDTRKLTMVSGVYPERRAVELDNGDVISILQFTGSNLDMAPPEIRNRTVEEYSSSISASIQNDIQFYLPMRPVSLDSTISVYRDRSEAGKSSVENKRFMDKYLEDRVEWLQRTSESTYIREQYVVVRVSTSDVIGDDVGVNQEGIEQIPGGDIVKDVYEGFTGETRLQSDQEIERKKLRELANRVQTVGSALAIGSGNDFEVASTQKEVALLKEFWEGEKILEDEMDSMAPKYSFSVMGDQEQGDKL